VAIPAPLSRERSAVRAHLPASERAIREHLRDLPDWMIEECLLWTHEREDRGWQFTSGTAAAIHWLDDAQRPARLPMPTAGQAGS
jgi:hypothetical protein